MIRGLAYRANYYGQKCQRQARTWCTSSSLDTGWMDGWLDGAEEWTVNNTFVVVSLALHGMGVLELIYSTRSPQFICLLAVWGRSQGCCCPTDPTGRVLCASAVGQVAFHSHSLFQFTLHLLAQGPGPRRVLKDVDEREMDSRVAVSASASESPNRVSWIQLASTSHPASQQNTSINYK